MRGYPRLGRCRRRITRLGGTLFLVLAALLPAKAGAERLAFRTYQQIDGLTDLNPSCLLQDRSGYILACTTHGVYVYDGRRFLNLGRQQGLPEGGEIKDLVATRDGLLVVRFQSHIYVSHHPLSRDLAPQALQFAAAGAPASLIYQEHPGRTVPWGDGALLVAHGKLLLVKPGGIDKKPTVGELDPRRLLLPTDHSDDPASPLLVQDGALWITTSGHRICVLTRHPARCFGPAAGLPAVNWFSMLPSSDGHLLARASSQLADIDPVSGRIGISRIPDQADYLDSNGTTPALFRGPNGSLITQSRNGLILRTGTQWTPMTAADGLPRGDVMSMLFDHEKSFWIGMVGAGMFRAVGYGLWKNQDRRDGLSSDEIWQMARQPHGPLWIASDGGLDAIGETQPPIRPHYDGAAFSLAFDGAGRLWRSIGANDVTRTDMSTGEITQIPLRHIDQMLPAPSGRLWFISQGAVYLGGGDAPGRPARIEGLPHPTVGAAAGPDGSLWLLHETTLVHRHPDGSVVLIRPDWGSVDFNPQIISISAPGIVWVGGTGAGLYRLRLDGDRLLKVTRFDPPDIVANTVVSLTTDKRGWLWVGTDQGVSVFNGQRWVSTTTSDGLIWNDLDTLSLLADDDGSIWIGTSHGLSHLLDPVQLFSQTAPQPVITAVRIDGTMFKGSAVGYSKQPLDIHFGTLGFRYDEVVRFRYRLEGVDNDWAETANGYARYPSLPPGHHRFEVVAFNPLTHQLSEPVSVLLRMRKPWWLWWPLLLGYVAASAALMIGAFRLRDNYLLRQKRALQREVDLRTREIREAQARDSLTGLLTRGEIQTRLMAMLEEPERAVQPVIGLLDIDHFKRINDQHGHLAGDDILQEIGRRLRAALQPGEHAGRYGGEEILLVLQGREGNGVDRMHALHAAVCLTPFAVNDNEMIVVTCSIGVTRAQPLDKWKTLIGRADKALYEAKAAGRDRLVVAATAL